MAETSSEIVKRVADGARAAVRRLDGWYNALTGLGSALDRSRGGRFVAGTLFTDPELTNLYRFDDVSRKIVSLIPEECMRKGFRFRSDNDPQADPLKDQIKRLKVKQKIVQADIWGRLYGGAAILIGANDSADMSLPLRPERATRVNFLRVIDRRYLWPDMHRPVMDLDSEDYGEPEWYEIRHARQQSSPIHRVHRSRLVFFGGVLTDDETRYALGGWDDSALIAWKEPVRMFGETFQGAAHMISDASTAVWKIKDLFQMISEKPELLQTRMQMAEQSRSIAHAVMVDSDGEDFERDAQHFAGLPDMMDRIAQRLAMASGIPVTILMGRSPAGMNATGEADFRAFYDRIDTRRVDQVEPCLRRILDLLVLIEGGDPASFTLSWPALWETTEKETAEIRKLTAETDKIYVDAGIVMPEEIAASRFGDEWSPETAIDLKLREELLEIEKEKLLDPPDPPPQLPTQPPVRQPPQPPSDQDAEDPEPNDPEDPEADGE